ncbi:MAG: glycosyltransferase family 4 protein, partial [Eubacteriaceae bacterium]|nr:glycosyltransferase family 4 protein [Eubacteriaceae bacterium]
LSISDGGILIGAGVSKVYAQATMRFNTIGSAGNKYCSIYKNSNIYRYLYRFAFSNEYIITLSSKLLYDINIFNAKKTFVINNGIKDYSLNYTNLKNENFIILYLSHLQISKGIKDYVFSISCLIKNCKLNNQKIKGYIIGDEIDITKKYLNEFIKSNKIEHFITYLGPKYNQEKNEYLKKASVLVYPTLNDAFPLVLIEAMQFGIPVIATREGAIPEIVDDGVTGFLVDKHSPDQIAEKLKILLDDDVLRNNMGKSARKKYLEKYTIEVFEKNLIDVFQKISLELK